MAIIKKTMTNIQIEPSDDYNQTLSTMSLLLKIIKIQRYLTSQFLSFKPEYVDRILIELLTRTEYYVDQKSFVDIGGKVSVDLLPLSFPSFMKINLCKKPLLKERRHTLEAERENKKEEVL